MRPGNGEVLSFVVDFAHQRGGGVCVCGGGELGGVEPPGGLPQLVDDVHVFLGAGVALAVGGLEAGEGAQIAGCGVEVGCYDVPGEAFSGGR